MKKRVVKNIIFSFLIFFFVQVSYAQKIKGALNIGLNATQVDGDEVYGYHKFGWNIGPSAIIPFGKFSITLENIFSQKGSYQKPLYRDLAYANKDTGMYKLKLTYLEVPVLFSYTDKDLITFGVGISWARLTGVDEWEHGKRVVTTTIQSGPYARNDWEALLDLRLKVYKSLKFNFRYSYSMIKIRERIFKNGETRSQFNNVLTFRMMWIFNEKNKK